MQFVNLNKPSCAEKYFTFNWHLPKAMSKVTLSTQMGGGWHALSVEGALLDIAKCWRAGAAEQLKGGVLDSNNQWRTTPDGTHYIVRAWRRFGQNHLGTVFLDDGSVVEVWDGDISG